MLLKESMQPFSSGAYVAAGVLSFPWNHGILWERRCAMKVIVIGAGASGLAAAASLAKMGARVTVYEKNAAAGGVLAPVLGEKFEWSRPYSLQRFLPGQFFARWMDELGCSVPAVRIEQRYCFPEFTIAKPDGAAPGWLDRLLEERFPKERRGLKRFSSFCRWMRTIASAQEKIEFSQSVALKRSVIWNYLFISRYVDLRADALIDKFFRDEELKKILLSVLIEKGVEPGDFSGIGLPLLWSESLFDSEETLERSDELQETGICHIEGGSEKLIRALSDTILAKGGTILTGKAVRHVEIGKNSVKRVVLEDGTEDKADEGEALAVVITGDPRENLLKTVGKEHLPPDTLETLEGQKLRPSAFAVHLGLTGDLGCGNKVTHVYIDSAETTARSLRDGSFDPEHQGYILYSSSAWGMRAPEGKSSLSILAFAPRHAAGIDWNHDRDRLADELIRLAERQFPGISTMIEERVIETPEDYALMGDASGCVGGLAPDAGTDTLPHTLEGIRGLYLAGQYTGGGGSVGTVMRGAWQTAKTIESDYYLDAVREGDEDDTEELDG